MELRRARRLRDRVRAAVADSDQETSTRLVWLRRSLLFLSLLCLGIYAYASAEQLWADHRSRVWLAAEADRPTDTTSAPAPTTERTERTEHHKSQPEVHDPSTSEAVGRAPGAESAPAGTRLSTLADGDPVGRLTIPSLGVEGAVEHGNTSRVLRRAIGHLPGTALPGDGGHVVLAGHRDSFFRGLRRAQRGQEITLRTRRGEHVYRIDGLRIVGPHAVEVIAPTESERLTLVTCYPFDYVGPAPRRFIVTARPVDSKPGASQASGDA